MSNKLLVTMFFPPAMCSPGSVIAHYLPIAAQAMSREGWGVFTNSRSGSMDRERTNACKRAIEEGYTHILMLDCDHRHPPDIADRLLAHDVDVVGALNFKRDPPHYPCAVEKTEALGGGLTRHYLPKPKTGLVKCTAVGSGAILIRLSCLDWITLPWFYMPYEEVDWDVDEEHSGAWPGEDSGFCCKCNAAGIDIYCDTDITSPHLSGAWVGAHDDPEQRVGSARMDVEGAAGC